MGPARRGDRDVTAREPEHPLSPVATQRTSGAGSSTALTVVLRRHRCLDWVGGCRANTRNTRLARVTVCTTRNTPSAKRRTRDKVSKTYRLDEAQIEAARRALGAETATEAIEMALDMVLFRQELVEGTAALLGTDIQSSDDDHTTSEPPAAKVRARLEPLDCRVPHTRCEPRAAEIPGALCSARVPECRSLFRVEGQSAVDRRPSANPGERDCAL